MASRRAQDGPTRPQASCDVSLDRRAPADHRERFAKLKPGTVASWLEKSFGFRGVGVVHYNAATRHFKVPLKTAAAVTAVRRGCGRKDLSGLAVFVTANDSVQGQPVPRESHAPARERPADERGRAASIKLVGLPAGATRDDVRSLCAATPFHGALHGSPVVPQVQDGMERFAYINLSDGSVADRLVAALDGKKLRGAVLKASVKSVQPREQTVPSGDPSYRVDQAHAAVSADVARFWRCVPHPLCPSRARMLRAAHIHVHVRRTCSTEGVLLARSRLKTAVDGGLIKVEELKLHEPRSRQQWLACWSAASAGSSGSLEALVSVLLMAPARSDLAPPTLDVVQVLSCLVARLPTGKPADALSALENVCDVVTNRLLGHEARALDPDIVLQHVSTLSDRFVKAVQQIMLPENLARTGPLMGRFGIGVASYQDALRRAIVDVHNAGGTEEATIVMQPWMGWVNEPTIGWLMSTDWLSPPEVRDRYEDAASYCVILQQLTTLLTFYWGGGAISPRCRHTHPGDDANKRCDEPLLTMCGAGRHCTARLPSGRLCHEPAVVGCPKRNHADHLCARCLRRGQLGLMGNPKQPKAYCSTDIYDATVEREHVRREGHVYILSHMRSRKPPAIPPNWRTTYRLSCASLVAVGRLTYDGEPLQPSTRIFWAEVSLSMLRTSLVGVGIRRVDSCDGRWCLCRPRLARTSRTHARRVAWRCACLAALT
jgi:hypothetical protein